MQLWTENNLKNKNTFNYANDASNLEEVVFYGTYDIVCNKGSTQEEIIQSHVKTDKNWIFNLSSSPFPVSWT